MGRGLSPLQREILDLLESVQTEERPELWCFLVPDEYDPFSPFEPTAPSSYRRTMHSLADRGLVQIAYYFTSAKRHGGPQAQLVLRLTLTEEQRISARNLALHYWNCAVEYAEWHQELSIGPWYRLPDLDKWNQRRDVCKSWVEDYEAAPGIPATDPLLMERSHGTPRGSTNHKTRAIIDAYLRDRRQILNSGSAPPRQHINQSSQPGPAFTLGPYEAGCVTPHVISNLGEKYGDEAPVFLVNDWRYDNYDRTPWYHR